MNDDADMPAPSPLARSRRIVRPRTLATIVCLAVLAIARSQQPASAHADTATDGTRLEAQLADARKINQTAEPARARAAFAAVGVEAERLGLAALQAEAILGEAAIITSVEPKQAKAMVERSITLFRQAGDELGEARATRELGVALDLLGDRAKAMQILQGVREVFARRDARLDLALTYQSQMYLADLGARRKLYPDALAAARAAGGAPWIECSIHHSMGDEEFMTGEYASAYQTLSKALACYERTDKISSKGRVLVSLGRVERAHGQYERALAFYERAYALQQQAHDEPAAIQSLNAIAVAYGYLDREDEARRYYEDALQRARALGSDRFVGFMLGNLAGSYVSQGGYERAIDLLREALTLEKNDMVRAYRYLAVAQAQYGLGRFDDALTAVNEAVRLADETDSADVLIKTLAARAEIEQRLKRLDASDGDIAHALNIVEDLRQKTLAQDFMKRGFSESTQEVFRVAIEVRSRRGDARGALEYAEQARARAFLDLLASRRTRPATSGSAAAGASVEAMVASAALTPYLGTQPQNAMDLESSRTVRAPNANEMIATAKRLRSTLLVYWVSPGATLAWVITPAGQITSTTIDTTPAQLAELARATTSPLKGGAGALSMLGGSALKPWRELYRILIKPVREHLPATAGSLVTIVPHGPLFQVSFAGLQNEDDGRYLIESYRLHYTPSIGVLSYTSSAPAHTLDASAKALLVGDPSPAASDPGDEALAALPWARREVTEIGSVLGPRHARVVTEGAATETRVRQEIERADLLHFATHGVIRQAASMSSFLALAQPDTRPNAGELPAFTDGKLTADEVYGLRLHADLVVLSACGTALGPMSGDGVIGFTRAFLYAGARSVIATEWNVPDQTGYELMRRFYRFRRVNGETSDALRNAQISMLTALRKGAMRVGAPDSPPESQVALRENPLFWAGFVLVGEP